MAGPWEQFGGAQSAPPAAGPKQTPDGYPFYDQGGGSAEQPGGEGPWSAFKDTAAPSTPADMPGLTGAEPSPIPQAFLDRVAAGKGLNDAMQDKQSALQKLFGVNGPRYELWPERMARSGLTIAGDVLAGKVVTGPGLRKEDFSDDPDAPQPLDELIARAQDMAGAQIATSEFARARPLLDTGDGSVARPFSDPDGTMRAHPVGTLPTPVDFKNAATALGGEHTAANLRQAWQEQGIHPAEAAHDAQADAFLRHDLTAKQESVKLDPAEEETLAAAGERPASLSAAATDAPTDAPLSVQPSPPPGRILASLRGAGDQLMDIGRDTQRLIAPMATGTNGTRAVMKDFANATRRNRWEWGRIDDAVAKEFDPETRKVMWDAADEESVLRQEGQTNENMGLARLSPRERAVVQDLHARAQVAWAHARDLGMVEGEGLPAYTPRMVINVAAAADKEGPLPLNGIGTNLRTRTSQMLKRQYLTAEETEAAAKAKFGDEATLARDIRVLPLATAQLENAVAGRTLINNIKEYGKRAGAETVSEGAIPEGSDTKWFTLDHPAFKTWRPKFKEGEGGKLEVVKDAEGNTIFEQVPIYVHGDFRGNIEAVLGHTPGPKLYQALMSIKAKSMSLIMNSPLIHNAVELGRAFPAMPTRIIGAYFRGNRAKNDLPFMREAIDNGLVPIGKRFFNQDVTSIMESPDLTPGRSITSKIAAAVPGLFDPAAEVAVKRAIDKAGDFWHNTLLWDRIGDLQMGLYSNFRDDLIAKGVDQQTASRVSAHLANRYAGALPQEAMSDGARKVANLLMFSRTFTIGNLGVLKDVLTGLPRDVLAQIERDAGTVDPNAVGYAKALAKRKAFSTVMLDIGLLYVANSIGQSVLNMMLMDKSLDEESHGYVRRYRDMVNDVNVHPLSLVTPLTLAGAGLGGALGGPGGALLGGVGGAGLSALRKLSATSDNEPGKDDRLKIGYAKDGTAIYARSPFGKIGEEYIGYLNSPIDMFKRKEGTIARPLMQVIANDRGFGRKVYDPSAETPQDRAFAIWQIVEHFAKSQMPEGQMSALGDLTGVHPGNLIYGKSPFTGPEGDPTVNKLQAFGPLAGVTFSKGAPGGPAVGEYYSAKSQFDYRVQMAMPDVRKQILRGDVAGAQQRMTELGMDGAYQRWVIKTAVNPATRLSAKGLRDFYRYATPEQRARMENLRQPGPLTPQE